MPTFPNAEKVGVLFFRIWKDGVYIAKSREKGYDIGWFKGIFFLIVKRKGWKIYELRTGL